MTLIQIKPEDFKVTAWSGGITEEIWIDPLEANFSKRDFICRISTAVVEADQSIFTKLSDYNRFIDTILQHILMNIIYETETSKSSL